MPHKIFILFSVLVMSSVSLSETSTCPLNNFDYYKAYRSYILNNNILAISTDIQLNQSMNSYEAFQNVLATNQGVANQKCSDVPPTMEPSTEYNVCPWHYVCDYDPLRIPQAMYHAKCNTIYGLDIGTNNSPVAKHLCTETTYAIPTLKTTDCPFSNTAKWDLQIIPVPVSCVAKAIK